MTIVISLMLTLAEVPSFYGPVLAGLLQDPPKNGDMSLIAPILNVGAVGACLIVLALYFKSKDGKYEARIDASFAREREFGEKYADLAEKYRTALEKTNATLDTVLQLLRQQSSR